MYKKVWVYILIIIVVSSLFPSILLARAEEEEGGTGDIPDLTYSFKNAPFPGQNDRLTKEAWDLFLLRAEDLGHTEIRKVEYIDMYFKDGSKDRFVDYANNTIFYSTDGTDVEKVDEIEDVGYYRYYAKVQYKDLDKVNIIDKNGHKTYLGWGNGVGLIFMCSRGWNYDDKDKYIVTSSYYSSSVWYSAEVTSDPYQELPDKYNIDSEMGYGMYFIKPKNGEIITIPYKNSGFRDSLEIEIIVPQFYMPNEGLIEMLYEIKGDLGKVIWPNFVIRLYSHNVDKIWGSKRPNDTSEWILQHDIEFVEGYYDSEGYMYAAKFKGKVPIDHKIPADEGTSLIVADLYIDYSNNAWERQEYRLDDARTWVRYLTMVGIVDEDGDGIDDRTGLPLPIDPQSPIDEHGLDKPDIEDYDSTILGRLSYYWDSLVYYVKLPFYYVKVGIEGIIEWISNIGNFIDSFTSIFERLFSFLPTEVTTMLALGFSTLMIITIVRAIRGS